MIAGSLPPGCTPAMVDGCPPSPAEVHRIAVAVAPKTIPCSNPVCHIRRDNSCDTCFGTGLLPATVPEWEDSELLDCMNDLEEFVIQRLEKIDPLEDLARPLRSSIMAMQRRLEQRKANRAKEAASCQ